MGAGIRPNIASRLVDLPKLVVLEGSLAQTAGRVTDSVVEVPIVFTDRVRGYSKMSWFIFAEELLLVTWWGMRDRTRRLWRRRRPG